MKVKIKKLVPEAVIPNYSKEGDAGMDLVAISEGKRFTAQGTQCKELYEYYEYSTGLSIEIPEGFVGLVFPRSSISKTAMILCNSVGIIDSGYRGEILCRFKTPANTGIIYNKGDKISQLVIIPYPTIEFEEVEELATSERGEGGFGSTN